VLLRSIVVEREPIYRQQETAVGFAPELFGLARVQMPSPTGTRRTTGPI